ncbi:MAG TPA: sigma-70 family RNA polymerase sigma factor [Bryobacteraceae bacterium]|nr:sigma-70 family RNA polymerase sigma factor [Bryobacteraceae bacterium]
MPAFASAGASRAEFESNWRNLIRRIAAADQGALAALYDTSNRLVYGMVLRVLENAADAEEVTLDIYSQVWRSAARFDGQRGTAVAWLLTIARTRAIDRLRAGGKRASFETPLEGTDVRAAAVPPVEPGVGREVAAALASLAPEQREAIELAYWHGYSHSELADRLGQPLGTVKTRIRMGMMKLRAQLGALA